MVSRVTPSGTQVPGTPAPSAFANGIAGGWLLYLPKTATQASINAEVTITGLSGSCTLNSSRRVLIVLSGICQMTQADTAGLYRIKQDGVTLNSFSVPTPANAGGPGAIGVTLVASATPAAGTRTYSATLAETTGTGTITEISTTGFLMVLDVGPA